MIFTSYNMFVRDLGREGLEYAVEHAASLGFSSVEFLDFCGTQAPIDKSKYPVTEFRRELSKNGLVLDCYSVYANLLCEDKAFFESEIRRQIDYAAEIGSRSFHHTIIPSEKPNEKRPPFADVYEEMLERTGKIAEYCADHGMNCLYEPQGYYFNGVQNLSKLILDLRKEHSNVGMCADFGNSTYVDCDPVDVMQALGQYTKQVHIKDYLITDAPLGRRGEGVSLGGKYLNEVLPGEGILDLARCLQLVKNAGYDGGISLEYVCDDETAVKSMKFIKDLLEE